MTEYDGGEDVRSSLLGRSDGRLEGELSSVLELGNVPCDFVFGCNASMASMRHA